MIHFRTQIFALFCLMATGLLAQIEVLPIYTAHGSNRKARTSAILDTLELPFIETFVGLSSDANWITNVGVNINNNFGRNQPSVGVATLDGVNGTGTPYVFLPYKNLAAGIGDRMTSKCINLSNVSKTDGLALSFFWQQGTPYDYNRDPLWDRGEQMRVFFKDSLENFNLVWPNKEIVNRIQATGLVRDTFLLENILVEDPIYYHKGFQIKLEYYGTLVGNYAVFNIDNLYLNKGVAIFNTGDTTYFVPKDYAFSLSPSTLLKNYSSVPLNHFLAAENSIINDTIFSSMYSLDELFITDTDSSLVISNKQNGAVIYKSGSDVFDFYTLRKGDPTQLAWAPNKASLKAGIDALIGVNTLHIQSLVSVLTPDSLQQTDSTSSISTLSNYYAYDDATIEAGMSVRGVAEMVQTFDFIKNDAINGFYIYFPKYGINLENTFLTFNVYSALKGVDGKTEDVKILAQNGVVEYSTDSISLNKFVFIPISVPLSVQAGKYYFGISQNNDSRILVGLDYSNNQAPNIYYRKFDDPWTSFAAESGYGCMAIRPVVSSVSLGTSIANITHKIGVFPNPSSTKIYFDQTIDALEIYTTMGDKIVEIHKSITDFDVSTLPKGVYLAKLSQENHIESHKLVVE